MKVIRTTETSVRKLKQNAKNLSKAQGIPLSAALDQIAKLAGYDDFHHVTACLAQFNDNVGEPPFALYEKAMNAVDIFIDTDSMKDFNAMGDALAAIFMCEHQDDRHATATEATFHLVLSRHPRLVPTVAQWLSALMNMPVGVDGQKYAGTTFACMFQPVAKMPHALFAAMGEEWESLEHQLEAAIGTGVVVKLARAAMLAFDEPLVHDLNNIIGTERALCKERAIGNLPRVKLLRNVKGTVPAEVATNYVIYGWAQSDRLALPELDRRIEAAEVHGLSATLQDNRVPLDVDVAFLCNVNGALSAWYKPHVQTVLKALDRFGDLRSKLLFTLIVSPEMPRDTFFDISFQISGYGSELNIPLPAVQRPMYLYMALLDELDAVSYQMASAD